MSRHRRPRRGSSDREPHRDRHEEHGTEVVLCVRRTPLQGSGHPPPEASFAERMAPYKGVVDPCLAGAVGSLCENVDVAFMKRDFSRFVAERMLVQAMSVLLVHGGKGVALCAIDALASMVENHSEPRPHRAVRNGHRAAPACHTPAE